MTSTDTTTWLIYLAPLVVVFAFYLRGHRNKQRHYSERLQTAVASGLNEPVSLHPVIDPARCLGSAACVVACPEHALGVIDGKAQLINASACIGHGACKASCPHDAINLVFGTEKRGVDIPQVDPHFESTVPGVFIAGELGGMGLIRKAVEQGKQAMETIAKRKSRADLDVVIVGAGPAGLAAALAATQHKLRYVIVEQEDSLGGTVYHYPRNKLVMTAPMQLPLLGKVKMSEISKESLLAFWQDVVKKTGLRIQFHERMETIAKSGQGYVVKTSKREYHTDSVLLAIGRRGTPRKLGVPGEEQAKVVYRLIDAEQYRGKNALVVGGGDSALEAALAIAEQPDTRVTLSYRGEAFARVKEKNRSRLGQASAQGRVSVLLQSQIKSIGPGSVVIEHEQKQQEIANDAVIVCAGGVLPTPFLKEIGILVETKYGTA